MPRTLVHSCPYCGAEHDAVSGLEDENAKPGVDDVSLCFKCGEWCVFTLTASDTLALRKPTDDELIEIGHDPECVRLRRAWQHERKMRQ